ncbi:MAG: phosphate starvation-inducible protein PhoH [Robiginitomaculum sp.]|nr:MAG: phosphate starvation-inducible protein PhoH [Robiginitomaculum sp.]
MTTKTKPNSLVLTFGDNAALRTLCGINHNNLAMIERAFSVQMHAPGGKITIEGAADDIALAGNVTERLYALAEQGEAVGEPQVRAELSFAGPNTGKPKLDQIQFGSGRRKIVPRNPSQQLYLQALKDQSADLVFGIGPAGTGKTFLAIAYGASLLLAKQVDRLIVARPALEAGERLGFLPGDLEEKVDPYMIPIWDALNQTIGPEKLSRLKEQGKIQIAPLAFMRGRTLADAYVVLDEAQNATIGQMQMVLTRLGEGGRMIVTGDPDQSDLPRGQESGLVHAVRILAGVEGISQHRFFASDVVRHPLVARIVRAYAADRDDQ